MFLKREMRLEVFGAGESSSMSSSFIVAVDFDRVLVVAGNSRGSYGRGGGRRRNGRTFARVVEDSDGWANHGRNRNGTMTTSCLPAKEVETNVPDFSTVVNEWLLLESETQELEAAEGSSLKRRSSRASSMVGREILNWSLFPEGLNPSP